MDDKYLHEVAITAIVVKDGKYLITRRTLTKKTLAWLMDGAGRAPRVD